MMPEFGREFKSFYQRMKVNHRLKDNLKKGEPGHPEGTTEALVEELNKNLDKIKEELSLEEYWRIRIMILAQNAFKPDTIDGVGSHTLLAVQFLIEEFFSYGWSCIGKSGAAMVKSDLLYQIQYHDELYSIWREKEVKGVTDEERLSKLKNRIDNCDVFLSFSLIDGITKGKERVFVKWFLREMIDKVETRVDKTWIKKIRD